MAKFSNYIPLLIAAEGGYQNYPSDGGNYNSLNQLVGTNHGISAPVYESWIGSTPSASDMQSITKDEALEIYRLWYWDRVNASSIQNQSIANIIVDHAVNAGVGAAGKLVQGVLNDFFGYNLAIDGAIGAMTVAAINNSTSQSLHDQIKEARKQHYESISGEVANDFFDGWINRLEKFVFKPTNLAIGGFVLFATIVTVIFLIHRKR